MIPKERVLTTFHQGEPDRVPVNYLANSGIDQRLKGHFGLSADDDDGLLSALDIDFRVVGPYYKGPRLHPEIPGRQVTPDYGIRTRWIEHSSGGYWDYCDFPLENASLEEIEAWPLPSADDYEYGHLAEACRRYENYGVCMYAMPDVINATGMIRTMEQVLVDLITDDEAGLRYIDRRLAVQLEVTARALEAAKGGIDLLWLGEDLGTQHAPLVSLDLFRKHIRPRHQPFVNVAKQFGAIPMEHTCGSSSWAYEDFITMGVEAVDTLQPEAAKMDPAYLKATFGGRLAFHGCISTAGELASGTEKDIERVVRETLEIMMPGGGYALAPTHMIQDDTSVANVLAMYNAARAYGRYR